MIKAVVFDLDDTLYPEADYVKSGFHAIEKTLGINGLADTLWKLFETDKNDVYQRAGLDEEQTKRSIEIYRNHKPEISLSNEVLSTLKKLKDLSLKTGIITDGRPEGQWNKIKALGLERLVDNIIVTDEMFGIEGRKPDKRAFIKMCEFLKVEPCQMVYVGDNANKDFAIAEFLPITTVQLLSNGLYANGDYLNNIKPTYIVKNITQVLDIVSEL
jgi:putative hydrolase of the HAD superfamily